MQDVLDHLVDPAAKSQAAYSTGERVSLPYLANGLKPNVQEQALIP